MSFLKKLLLIKNKIRWGSLFSWKMVVPAIILMVPTLSFAQNLFDVPSQDISLRVLSQIFGGLLPSGASGTGTSADPLMNAIKTFNGAVLVIGGILAAYTILAGTLGTAHDGEMLGKKFSSVWIPIRYSVGTALVLPVIGGGYCCMQAIVMWLVVQGVGLADMAWTSYMSAPALGANVTASTDVTAQIRTATQTAFVDAICVDAYKQITNPTGGSESIAAQALNMFTNYKYQVTSDTDNWYYGDTSGVFTYNSKKKCGMVSMPSTVGSNSTTGVSNSVDSVGTGTNTGYLGDLSNIFAPFNVDAIVAAHRAQTAIMVQSTQNLATQVMGNVSGVSTTAPTYSTQLDAIAQTYVTNLNSSVQQYLNQSNAFTLMQQSASQQGWYIAGAWFMRLIDINQKINDAVRMAPSATPPYIDTGTLTGDADQYKKAASDILAVTNSPRPAWLGSSDSANNDAKTSGTQASNDTADSWMVSLGGHLADFVTSINITQLQNDPRHPIIIINELGNRLISSLIGLTGILFAAAAVSGVKVLGTGADLGPAVQIFSMVFQVPFASLWVVGFSCTQLIPMMPFLIWLGCIIGWTILVIEAILAAPLWAVMHLHPNGDDLTGRGGNGYMLVLSLLLRPVLMIFGLVSAITLSSILGELINKVFFQTLVAAHGGSISGFSGFFTVLFGTVVYVLIMFTFVSKMFSIVHMIPDQLMRWIGGGGGELGQFAGAFEQRGNQTFGAAAGASIGALSSAKGNLGQIGGGFAGVRDRQQGKLKEQEARIANDQKEKDTRTANESRMAEDQHDKGFDASAGSGASAIRDTFSSMKGNADNKASYENAAQSVTNVGGASGRSQFEDEFRAAEEDKFSSYNGNAQQAATAIGAKLSNEIATEKFGSAGAAYISAHENISLAKAKRAINTLTRMTQRLGSEQAQQVIQAAISQGGDASTMTTNLETGYNQALAANSTKPSDDTTQKPE